jgi:hypothetical protein
VGVSPALAGASFHVSGTDASGSDPVVLGQGTEFSITKIDGGAGITAPLTIYFAVPVGDAAPKVTFDNFDGGAKTAFGGAVTSVGVWSPGTAGAAKDLYAFVGCTGCDNSLNAANLEAEELLKGDGTVTKFAVFDISISQAFAAKNDVEDVFGLFANGTVVAPLAFDTKGKLDDTSWTNTGFVNGAAIVGTPEPSTWLLGLTGFGFIAAMGWKRKRTARYAISA